jgi:hypothetical protein
MTDGTPGPDLRESDDPDDLPRIKHRTQSLLKGGFLEALAVTVALSATVLGAGYLFFWWLGAD